MKHLLVVSVRLWIGGVRTLTRHLRVPEALSLKARKRCFCFVIALVVCMLLIIIIVYCLASYRIII